MTAAETTRLIKKEFRANMNGAASNYMRRGGLNYRVNFGIELPRLREIASQFEPDYTVAQMLWSEDVRESKVVATMLMPEKSLTPNMCDEWARQIPNAEIAQMAVMNLFARLPYARTKAFEWMATADPLLQLCGFLLATRLHLQGDTLPPCLVDELAKLAETTLPTADLHLRKAIQNALTHVTRREGD